MRPAFRIKFIKKPSVPDLKGIITLYRAQGWWQPGETASLLRRIIAGSHCFAVAVRGRQIIGMGRAVSDGASDAYIQDMTVLPGERSKGAGAAILRAMMARLEKDGIRWVALIAQDNSQDFYRKAGFRALKNAHPMLSRGSYV